MCFTQQFRIVYSSMTKWNRVQFLLPHYSNKKRVEIQQKTGHIVHTIANLASGEELTMLATWLPNKLRPICSYVKKHVRNII